jgi:hypothetical protein
VKLLNLKTYLASNEEIIETNSIGTQSYYFDTNGKFIFEFSKNDFYSYKIDAKNFDIKNIVIGVIRREDYKKNMSEIEFNMKLNWEDIYLYEKISFPYSLINYQQPKLVYNGKDLLKTVSSCVHFTYGRVASYLHNWIDIHLSLGISQIVIYDSTSDYILTSFVQKNFNENQVKMIQYRIKEEDLCADVAKITDFPKIQELLKKYCLKFYENEFKDYKGGRFKHEQITSNDCFTQMSKKHEYVTYYDLDEFIYPRSMNMKFKPAFKCDDPKKNFCSINPFQVKSEHEENTTSYYNYLENLVEKFRDGRDKSKLASILFQHAAYHIPNKASDMLFNELNQLIEAEKSNKTKFPLKIVLSHTSAKRHSFEIKKEDMDHVRYISKAYDSIAKCLFENKLLKKNTTLDKTLQRYFYFITEPDQRWPKSIHYSKNSRALFIHFPTDTAHGSWELKPSFYDGHMLPHFREDMNWFAGNFEGSIQKLNIDFEYLFFMIKKFTSQC